VQDSRQTKYKRFMIEPPVCARCDFLIIGPQQLFE